MQVVGNRNHPDRRRVTPSKRGDHNPSELRFSRDLIYLARSLWALRKPYDATMKNKIARSAVLGLLALSAGFVALIVVQVCFVESFWLHAMVAPLNPQSVFQPTSLTYVGAICQIVFEACLIGGVILLGRSGWLWVASLRNRDRASGLNAVV